MMQMIFSCSDSQGCPRRDRHVKLWSKNVGCQPGRFTRDNAFYHGYSTMVSWHTSTLPWG